MTVQKKRACLKEVTIDTSLRNYRKAPEAISRLTPEQFRITRQSGTELPNTGRYLHNTEPGIYVDIVSASLLFASSDKYESRCGWPSFTKPIEPANIKERRDASHGMIRTGVDVLACGSTTQPYLSGADN